MPSQTSNSQNQPMTDATADETNFQDPPLELEEQRLRVLQPATSTAISFQFDYEDHTLGNALRYIIMKNPDVEFCGYSIPHPSEAKMNLRIQTYGSSAYDVLEKGLDDLMDLCDIVSEKFITSRDEFMRKQKT